MSPARGAPGLIPTLCPRTLGVVQISRRSRQRFADLAAADGTVRTIEEAYAVERVCVAPGVPGAGGWATPCRLCSNRTGHRSWRLRDRGARLLRVYLAGIDDWGRQTGFAVHAA